MSTRKKSLLLILLVSLIFVAGLIFKNNQLKEAIPKKAGPQVVKYSQSNFKKTLSDKECQKEFLFLNSSLICANYRA